MNYWLMKSEPNTYSIDDLEDFQIDHWDGIRNYQARNMIRDDMKQGDLAFFYHSNCKVPGIVGIMEIVKGAYPDFTAWDINSDYFDSKSSKDNPRWYMVDVKFVKKFTSTLSLEELKKIPGLEELRLVKKGNRLSVMPVSPAEWDLIMKLVAT